MDCNKKNIMNVNDKHTDFKSGFVTILGVPNVGKSTLLNRMIGAKISITSKKPQTTRNRILGVAHKPSSQIVFLDTPGVFKAKSTLNRLIVDAAFSALDDGDIILILIDSTFSDTPSEELLVKRLKQQKKPVILALNKTDLLKKKKILTELNKWQDAFPFKKIIPISAKHGTGVEELLESMESLLPPGPPYFPEESLTDLSERFIVAEMIREKVFRLTGQEIPYSTAVTIDSFKEDKKASLVTIYASIHLEHKSQKGIIIGRGGTKLKKIGTDARAEIERLLGCRVYLNLLVRVQKNWSKDTKALKKFGL